MNTLSNKPSSQSFQEQTGNVLASPASSSASPFAHAAEKLVDRGFVPVPIVPRDKRPLIKGWTDLNLAALDGERDADFRRWLGTPGLNVGVLLGNGWAVIDNDTPNDHPLATKVAERIRQIAGSAVSKASPARGGSVFVRFDLSSPLRSRKLAGVVDVLSTGRQTVLPPSIHPSGGPYIWTGEVALWDADPEHFRVLTEADIDALERDLVAMGFKTEKAEKPKKEKAPRPAGRAIDEEDFVGRVKATALERLSAWVPALNLYGLEPGGDGGFRAVPTWRASTSGRPLAERGKSLGIHPAGITDFGDDEGLTAIDLVMKARRASFAEALHWLADRLGIQEPLKVIEAQPVVSVVPLDEERARLAGFVRDAATRVENIKQLRQVNGATRRKIERLLTDAGSMPHGHARQALVAAARSLASTYWGTIEVHLADAQPGVGKTTAVVENIESYVYFAPTTALAREHAAQSGATLVVAQSGTDAKGKANCKRSGYLEPIRKAGGSQSMLCGKCPHRDFCPVVAALQAIKVATRVVASHADLGFARDGLPVGTLPVIDEVPWSLEIGLGGHAIDASDLIPTDDPRSGHQWHALAAIRDAIEAHRAKYPATLVEHLPEADLWGIPDADIAADMAALEHRKRQRHKAAAEIVGKGGVGLRRDLQFEATKLGNIVADDRLRLQILQAADAVDDRFSLPPDHIVTGIAISGAGVQCVAPRKIHGQHLEAGVALFLTATPPPELIVRAMFSTAITFKGDGDDAPEITIEPVVEIVRFGARPIARPAANRIEIVTGAPITEGDRADVAKVERLAKIIKSAPPAPVVATESMRTLIGPMLPDADLRSFGKMVGLNELKDRSRIEVVGYSRRRAEDAEAALVGWLGLWVPRRKWQAVIEHQTMIDGTVAPLRTSYPVPSRAYAELDFAPCGKLNLPGPLFGWCELIREDESGRAVANVWQAIERIRLINPSSDDAGKVARVFADVVLPVPVDQVSAMSEADDDAHVARMVAEIEGNWAPDPVCPIAPPTSAIPTSFEIAQALGIVGEMDKNRWSKSMRKAQIGNPENASVLSIAISRIASSRIRTAAFGNWEPMLHRLAPQIAADQLSAKIGKPVMLHPEDALPRGAVPATAHMLRQLGYADTDADARQVEAQMKGAPDRRRFRAAISDGDDIARSLWLVPAELEPVEAIAATLSARLQGRSLVSVEEIADDEHDFASFAVLPMSREGIMSAMGISDRKARALVARLESADGRHVVKVKTATAKQALRFSVANSATAEVVRQALDGLGIEAVMVEGLQPAPIASGDPEKTEVEPMVADEVAAPGDDPAAQVEPVELDPLVAAFAALLRDADTASRERHLQALPPPTRALIEAALAAGAG